MRTSSTAAAASRCSTAASIAAAICRTCKRKTHTRLPARKALPCPGTRGGLHVKLGPFLGRGLHVNTDHSRLQVRERASALGCLLLARCASSGAVARRACSRGGGPAGPWEGMLNSFRLLISGKPRGSPKRRSTCWRESQATTLRLVCARVVSVVTPGGLHRTSASADRAAAATATSAPAGQCTEGVCVRYG